MEILMNVLKDKKGLIKFLLETIDSSEKEKIGILKLSESLTRDRENANLSIDNMAKCISTTMKITSKQSDAIKNLAIIALIQCQSSDFDVAVAHMLNKMGRGNEALRQMMYNKLNGK